MGDVIQLLPYQEVWSDGVFVCRNCLHKFISVYPDGMDLLNAECPKCEEMVSEIVDEYY